MACGAAWGVGKALSGKEAARIAVERALDQMGTARPVAAIVLATQDFDAGDVAASLAPLLPNVPMWGFNTTGVLTAGGEQTHSVAVMILSGPKLTFKTFLFAEKTQRKDTLEGLLQAVGKQDATGVLLAGDGYSALPEDIAAALERQPLPVCGGLASGLQVKGKTYQIGGEHAARGGISALVLGGRFRVAYGVETGWVSTGRTYRVTKAEELWVSELDGKAPAACYAEAFGYPARDWAFSPLKELVRLYPLGVQSDADKESLVIHAPLWVEADGRFRVNLPLEQGKIAHLMIGDCQSCLQAVEQAVQDAVSQLGEAQPIAALVWMDAAWQMLFEGQANDLMSVVNEALPDVPVVGAYTFGQLAKVNQNNMIELYNQCVEIVLIGTVAK